MTDFIDDDDYDPDVELCDECGEELYTDGDCPNGCTDQDEEDAEDD